MLVVAPIVVGIIGVVVERTIIRFLYGRMIDTMLATWGLSLFLVGLATPIFGNTTVGISAPLGSFQIGAYQTSAYTLFVIAVAAVVLAAIFAVMRWTRLGLIARGTMQNANMAAALGVNPPRVYAITFGVGAALSGLAGGVLAPVSGVLPTIGVAYIAKSFITVIGGGAAILTGTVSASALFGTINQIATFVTTPGVRRGRLARRRHRPDALAAARHHRPLLPERPVNGRALNLLGLGLVGVVGIAFLVLMPRLFELDVVLELTVYMIMAILALSLGADLGLWRHPLLRAVGLLRPRRLHLRHRGVQHRREHDPAAARDRGAGRLRGAARLFHVLRPHQRRLSRRHHADGDADPVQFD